MSGGPSPGVSAMSRSLKARASAQKKRNQTIDIGSYHCPVTLATKIGSAPAWTSLAGGDYLIHIKSEGVSAPVDLCSEIYSRDEISSRWVLTVISPQPI
jgi:hypothetical protein